MSLVITHELCNRNTVINFMFQMLKVGGLSLFESKIRLIVSVMGVLKENLLSCLY